MIIRLEEEKQGLARSGNRLSAELNRLRGENERNVSCMDGLRAEIDYVKNCKAEVENELSEAKVTIANLDRSVSLLNERLGLYMVQSGRAAEMAVTLELRLNETLASLQVCQNSNDVNLEKVASLQAELKELDEKKRNLMPWCVICALLWKVKTKWQGLWNLKIVDCAKK